MRLARRIPNIENRTLETRHAAGNGKLLPNTVLFARLLRVGGLAVTPPQVSDWVAALDTIDLAQKSQVKNSARAILVSHHRELDWFDQAFELFWRARTPEELERLELGFLLQRESHPMLAAEENQPGSGGDASEPLASWSKDEHLANKSFSSMSSAERREVERLIARMQWHPPAQKSRRFQISRQGSKVDLRSALRGNLSNGGELIELPHRRNRLYPRPLTVLCDVSGSMKLCSRLLLHFVYALNRQLRDVTRVESFAFSTRLTRLSQDLRSRNIDAALERAARHVHDWGGGTRTGEVLRLFHRHWAPRVLGRNAIVLIISDGWDRGDPKLLGRELARLSRLCDRLVWLNPLLGTEGYQPLTRGMQAALPHLDNFLPVHNLRSLQQLAELLESL